MLNPFLLAGLVFAGIGLVQEAIFADEDGKKKIAGPAGKDGTAGKDGKAGVKGKDGKDGKAAPKVEPASDG